MNNADTEADSQLSSPDIFFTFLNGSALPATAYIPPNTFWNVILHINFDALISGSKSYTSKHLEVLINRPATTTTGRVILILDVYFAHCYVLSSRSRCTNFPGCTFCFYPSGIAVFNGEVPSRRLFFADSIPEYSKKYNEVNLDDGVCVDAGSRSANEACRALSTYGAGEAITESSLYAIIAGVVLMIATVPFLITLVKRSGRIVHV